MVTWCKENSFLIPNPPSDISSKDQGERSRLRRSQCGLGVSPEVWMPAASCANGGNRRSNFSPSRASGVVSPMSDWRWKPSPKFGCLRRAAPTEEASAPTSLLYERLCQRDAPRTQGCLTSPIGSAIIT